MTSIQLLILSMFLGVIVYGLVARWYIFPLLKPTSRDAILTAILLLHSTRFVGLAFLIPGIVSPELAAAFSVPAAYGDLATTLLALIALAAVRLKWPAANILVWIFNVAGTIDLLYAVFQGLVNNVVEQLGAAYFIPVLIVPALLVSHYVVFRILLMKSE